MSSEEIAAHAAPPSEREPDQEYSEEADVLIVGGGPIGLTLAANLSFHEVSNILLECKPTTSSTPKAISIKCRAMEHFRRIGLEKKIRDASYPRELSSSLSFSTTLVEGKELFRKTFCGWGNAVDGDAKVEVIFHQNGASPSLPMVCPQFVSEAVIRKHIEETSEHARLNFGWSVTAISQDKGGVMVKAVNSNGREKVFRGRYLAACDGGKSFVRKELGLHTYGHYVLLKAFTISVSSPELMDKVIANSQAGFATTVNRHFVCVSILMNGKGRFSMHLLLSPSISDDQMNRIVENPAKCVEWVIGTSDIPYDILSADAYNMHALLSTKYREGRIFFAGDSAHQWLPLGGLGLNIGIIDAANLSWKMAATLKGYGGKYLLDSYEIECRSHADISRRFAMAAMAPILRIDSIRSSLAKYQPFWIGNPITRFLLARSFFFSKALGHVVLGLQYPNSNIIMHQYNVDNSITLHRNIDDKYKPCSLPGCRAPHVVLPEHQSTLDLFSKHFVLLTVGGAEDDLAELREVLSQKQVPFSTHTYPPLQELAQVYNRKYFLIRPDGIIAWRSDFQPSHGESLKIVATVLGHMPKTHLPLSIETYCEPEVPAIQSFARDAIARLVVTGLLVEYTQLPFIVSGAIGLGVFLLLRAMSVGPPRRNVQAFSRHKALTVSKYGDANSVLEVNRKQMGKFGPEDVLVKVHASSVTALDVSIRNGRGAICYEKMAHLCFGGPYFPLVLGRDCSGEVVAVGDNVTKFLPGDLVYAAIPPHCRGAHAQLVSVHENHLAIKPKNLDHKEAASLPWAAMTVWSALVECAGLDRWNARGKEVLVLNGTGALGSVAVQLLKAWGASVTTTCAKEDTALARHLGADKVLDDQTSDISSMHRCYDVVLDTLGGRYESASLSTLKYYHSSVYVTTVSPHDTLVDTFGAFVGCLFFSTIYRFKVAINRLFGGRGFHYSSTKVSAGALDELRVLVEKGAVRPLVDAVYSLDEMIAAHQHVEASNTRGTVVISIDS